MLPPIPVLGDYGISPTRGFLPEVLPLTRLPDPYYNKWEAIAANLQALILSKRLRGVIDRLPVLSTIGLEHDAEWRRAYSLLAFMAHSYIWGGDSPSDRLPASIAVPLLAVSSRLEVPPVATYAAVCLWNFKPLFVDEDIDNLDNLATLNTFTGALDESWFYLVSVAIEARGAPTIPLMLTAIAAARDGDARAVTRCLRAFAERLDDLGTLLHRMHENCDPAMFYNRIRPFLAGSKNMAEAGLPSGIVYEDGSGHEYYRQYAGGSNAQSSIIQFFDIVLGIEHRPTGSKGPSIADGDSISPTASASSARHNFIAEMRRYMPGPHARFLCEVQSVANIRTFVTSRPDDTQLATAYDACLSMLRALRDRHLAIVARYIVNPSADARARSRSRSPEAKRNPASTQVATAPRPPRRLNLASASSLRYPSSSSLPQSDRQQQQSKPVDIELDVGGHVRRGADATSAALNKAEKEKRLKGTGGTALMAFLRQARDETGEPAVEEWTRRFMRRRVGSRGRNDFFLGKDDMDELELEASDGANGPTGATSHVDCPGLAGLWTVEDEVGGICNY